MTTKQTEPAIKSLIHHSDIEWEDPKTLKRNPKNARVHNRKQRRALMAAIRKFKHPTVKPLALVADAILDCSHPDDVVFDPFLGSGTTMVAAHKMGRRGRGIEIDPVYADVVIRRLTEATGLPAIHKDGSSFDEVAAQRRSEMEEA